MLILNAVNKLVQVYFVSARQPHVVHKLINVKPINTLKQTKHKLLFY